VNPGLPTCFSDHHRSCLAGIFGRIIDYYAERMVSLVVFGSYARGEPRLDSDLDLFVVLTSGKWSRLSERTEEFVVNIEEFCDEDLQALFEEGISMEISPVIVTMDEARNFLPLYLDMVSDCLVIADRRGFFAGVLERVRGQMIRWGSRRIEMSGHWLWEICPGLKWNEVHHYEE